MKSMLNALSDATNIGLTRKHRLDELKTREPAYFDLAFIRALPSDKQIKALELLDSSQSQLRQDVFALAMLEFPEKGYFVEFGATDGHGLSNTFLLEKGFGWRGILAEPAKSWHADLQRNRDCHIETDCVWRATGESLQFTETPRGENSAISSLVKARRRVRGTSYDVRTISMNDMLEKHGAPETIDYMSVDTEGSEFEILNAFDFGKHKFRVLTIEHNFTQQRGQIHDLLTRHGYTRVLKDVSRFDDWYLSDPSVLN